MSKETILLKAKTLLNLQEDQLEQLTIIVEIQSDALLAKVSEADIPKSLEYIVLETSIARYNRLGSEGLKNESIDVISQSFTDDLFEPYLKDIYEYNSTSSKSIKKLKLL